MAQYNFEGDLENINERQLEFIHKVVLEQDLQVNKVVFSQVGKPGDNFVANVKRISLEGDNGSLKLIVKIASTHEIVRKTTNTEIMFNNEITMYTEVLPKFVQLQKDAGVPKEEQLRYAKCYGAQNEAPNEVIILEDLNESDFVMLNKFESLSDESVKSILKNFAILHSLSYALKAKEPQTYDLFKEKLIDVWTILANNPEMMFQMQYLDNETASVLEDEKHKKIVNNRVQDMFKLALKLKKYEDNKHSIIQQGDAWTNNVMFKFVGDNLVQSIMIDYQAAKNSNPVVDILYMIFNCTDYETRAKNFYNWIDYYHTELEKSLSNFGLKANFVYPRDQLDADIKRYGKLLFGLCLMLANVLMRDSTEAGAVLEAMKSENLADMAASIKAEDLQTETLDRLRKRLIGLIDSFTEFGLL